MLELMVLKLKALFCGLSLSIETQVRIFGFERHSEERERESVKEGSLPYIRGSRPSWTWVQRRREKVTREKNKRRVFAIYKGVPTKLDMLQ